MSRANADYTPEDILRAMWKHHEVWEAVRREILPASLLEMSNNLLSMNDTLQDMVVLQWKPPTDSESSFFAYLTARKAAERRHGVIALEMGLEPRRLLPLIEVWRLAARDAASEYDDSQIANFRECMMVEADSPTEGECYVVVEVWGTTRQADVDQAVVNARMATRFTGKPAYPAVAAFRRADVPRSYFASKGVYWYRLRRPR